MLKFKYAKNSMITHLINTRFREQRACPHCRSSYTVLYGKSSGRQRYMCRSCGRTFSSFTGTPLAATHFPEKWEAFIGCMLKGMSLRAATVELKMSYVTLFYWRHKLLAALKKVHPDGMKGRVELQNFYMKYSEKGRKQPDNKEKRVHNKSMDYFNIENDKICVLTAIDLFQNIFSMAVCKGHMNIHDMEESIGKLLNKDNIVCSRPKRIFAVFLKRRHIKESKEVLDNTAKVTKYVKDCMGWMSRFKGVASKYLNNYLAFYKFISSINFDETLSGVKSMATAVSAVDIKNTYISIRSCELGFDKWGHLVQLN